MKIYFLYIIVALFLPMSIMSQTFTIKQLCEDSNTEMFGARAFNDDIYVINYENDSTAEINNERPFTNISIFDNCSLTDAELYSSKHKTNIPISSLKNDGPLSGSEDGKLLFFSNNSDSNLEFEMGIFYLKKSDSGWSESNSFPLNSPNYSCIHPFFDEASEKLYFASNMPGEQSTYSIYSIPFDGSSFGQYEIVSEIKSEYNELFPSIYEGDIYFTSDRKGGLGGMDVYLYANDSTHLLPYPLNSEYDDLAFTRLNERGAFLSSNRFDSGNKDQVFFVRIKESKQEGEDELIFSMNNIDVPTVNESSKSLFRNEEADTGNKNSGGYAINKINSSGLELMDEIDSIQNNLVNVSDEISENWTSFAEEIETLLFDEDISMVKEKIALEGEIRKLIKELNNASDYAERNRIMDVLKSKLEDYDENLANKLLPRLNEINEKYNTVDKSLSDLAQSEQIVKELSILNLRQKSAMSDMSLDEFSKANISLIEEMGISVNDFTDRKISKNTLEFIINQTETITFFFDFDSYNIRKSYNKTLLDFINMTQILENVEIQIEGHTDISGHPNYNMLLSKRRAQSIKRKLVRNGLDESIFKVKYFGITKPKYDNNTKDGRKKNRRVEIKLVVSN